MFLEKNKRLLAIVKKKASHVSELTNVSVDKLKKMSIDKLKNPYCAFQMVLK